MSGELCDAVLGRTGSAAMLEQVEAAGLFLKPLDEGHQWYRYHRLFAEALQARHQRLQPQRAADIQRRAAGWFEAAGWLVEAVEHARRSGDTPYYVGLLEQHAFRVMGQGEFGLTARWLAALPEAALRASPRLCLDQAWQMYLNRAYNQIDTWLEAAEAHLSEASERHAGLRGEALALRSLLESDPEQALRLGQEAAVATPASNGLVHGLIQMALANSYDKLGRLDQAFDAFEAAIPLFWEAGNLLGVFIASNDIVLLARPLGRLARAEALCQQLLARAQRSGLDKSPAAGVAYLGLAVVRLERGEWEAANDTLRQALKYGARSGLRNNLRADILAKQVEIGLDDVGHGGSTGQAPLDFASELENLGTLPPTTISRLAYQLVKQGHFEQAVPLLQHLEAAAGPVLHARDLAWRLVRIYQQVMTGIDNRDLASLQAAEGQAAVLAELADGLGWAGYLSELLALRALAEYTRRDLTAALAHLDRALALAERDRQVLVFVGKGRAMAELLTEALRQGVPSAPFAQFVLGRFPSLPALPRPAPQTELVEPLKERELEVLRLMADGLTYELIAQRLFVSVNTVRYHIKGLYGKLGTNSRAETIARGRALQLF
jgi:LuxR family maltose regulon positive regulatory protein